MSIRFDNMDAPDSVFFPRQLEAIRQGVLEVQYAELIGATLVPVKTDIDPGAEVYTYTATDMVGVAELMADMSDDSPTVEVSGNQVTSSIRSASTSYRYSIQESRNARMANVDLDPRKARAARRAMAQLFDDVMLLGDGTAAYLGLRGLFRLAGTDTYTTPVSASSGSKAWAQKTPDEVLFDMHGMINQVIVNTKEVEVPNMLGMPTAQFQDISTRRIGENVSTTILEQFYKSLPPNRPVKVFSSTKLAGIGAGTSDRAIAYRLDPDKLECVMPVPFEQMPPQFDGFIVKTKCHGRIGGVICYFPKSVIYADHV
jgi:hypothetical protein